MKVYLMRHCATVDGPQMDAERPLDDAGRLQAKVMRKFLKQAEVKPDLIISSNFARAEQTAEAMQRKRTPIKTTPFLRPVNPCLDSDVSAAWKSIVKLAGDAKAVLVITHGPMIRRLAAGVAFSLIDESLWEFEHGGVLYINTDDSRMRWFVSPKLAAHIVGANPKKVENVEALLARLQAELGRLSESLQKGARKQATAPLRAEMHKAVSRLWRDQARSVRKLVKGSAADRDSLKANIAAALATGRSPKFSKAHDRVKAAAYRAGVAHTAAQLGVYVAGAVQGVEAKKKRGDDGIAAIIVGSGGVRIPQPDGQTINDQGYNLQAELDRTTAKRAAAAIDGLAEGFTTADALAALAATFAGFTAAPGEGKMSRADTVALQTVSDGYHSGGRDTATEVANTGVEIEKHWDTQDDPCPVCVANEAEGWIPQDAAHDSGDFEPPAHPNCQCSESYRKATG